MEKSGRNLIVGILSALALGGCAVAGPRGDFEPTYVMVFTVSAGTLTDSVPHCAGDCSPGGFGDREPIFRIEDVGFAPGQRRFSEFMYSPQWQQPDLETARKWARCVVEAFDKIDPDFGKITVTSAYLIRVLAPADDINRAHREARYSHPCEVPAIRRWQPRK